MFEDVSEYLIRSPNASYTTDGSRSRRRLSIRGVTDFLAINNSYAFFEQTGGLLKTGPTHTNVMDVAVVLVAEA